MDILTENGGTVKKTEYWGLKQLAYRIKKNRKGHYHFFNIDTPSAALVEMERVMRLNEDVLRYLSIKVDKLDDEPSIMMRERSHEEGSFNRERSFDSNRESRHSDAKGDDNRFSGKEDAGDKPTEEPSSKATSNDDDQ